MRYPDPARPAGRDRRQALRPAAPAAHDVVMAHERGMIHYHDLDYSPFFPMFNCMLIDLKGMLTEL
ncbi:hypothetical protein MJ561_03450 [Klebsiella pneumoniae]|nr:hypothetical protein MJ561_03450 [Klebsiella pneumoniae]